MNVIKLYCTCQEIEKLKHVCCGCNIFGVCVFSCDMYTCDKDYSLSRGNSCTRKASRLHNRMWHRIRQSFSQDTRPEGAARVCRMSHGRRGPDFKGSIVHSFTDRIGWHYEETDGFRRLCVCCCKLRWKWYSSQLYTKMSLIQIVIFKI